MWSLVIPSQTILQSLLDNTRRWLGSGGWGGEAWRCHLRLDGLALWEPLASSGRPTHSPAPQTRAGLPHHFHCSLQSRPGGPGAPVSSTHSAESRCCRHSHRWPLCSGARELGVPSASPANRQTWTWTPAPPFTPSFTLRYLLVPQFLSRKDQVIPRLLRRTVTRINRRTALSTELGSQEATQPMSPEPRALSSSPQRADFRPHPQGSWC